MRHTNAAWAMGLVGMILGAIGCDRPPGPPRMADGSRASIVQVSHESEVAVARQLANARELYGYNLSVLHAYYVRVGAYQKRLWTEKEQKNLNEAQTFRFEGVEPTVQPTGPSLETADEISLVEQVVSARAAYQAAVEAMIRYYETSGQEYKAALARNVRERFDPIRTYNYFLDAEVPPATLRPTEVIPQADRLYAEAMKLYRDGKILPAVVDYQKERKALLKFRELVRDYPSSTKIAYAAYFIGEIYKEYFNEDYRSVLWYERAWQWDPNITEPARFQAAVVCDHRLHNRSRAVELYKDVIRYETFNSSNVSYARDRIEELTGQPYRP